MSAAIPQAMTREDVLQQAIVHREAGRYKEAARELRAWLASHPQDASAHALLSQVLSLDKQDDLAWVDMNTALSIDPALPIVQRNHARLLLRQQKTHAALQAAQAAYRSDATDPENQLVLAAALAANHRNEPAYQLVESALQSRPNYAEAFANRALLKLRNGDPGGALLDAEKCLAIKPHLAQMWGMAGALRHRFKNLPGAIGALENALDYEPDNAGFLMNLGEFKRQAGALDAAIVLLEKAVAIAPANAGAWVNLGAALQESRRIPEARAAYAKALEIAPKQAEVASNLGALAKEEENWEEALRYFDQALACQPASVAIMVNRAAALNALERYADAEQAARQAILLEPSHTEAYLALSSALIGQKHYEAAQAVLDTLKLPSPADTENARHLALSYAALFRAMNHWAEAEAWARKALAVKPKEVKVLRQLGVILDEQKRHEDAQAVFREALEYAPEDADNLQAMASHHARQEGWQEAEAWVRRVLAVKPNFAEAHSNLGVTLMKLGRPGEAEASCRRALALKPDYAEAHNSLGVILHELGRPDEAEASYRQALRIKPDFVDALNNLALLLNAQGKSTMALGIAQQSQQIKETEEAKGIFVACIKHLRLMQDDSRIRATMVRALTEPWGRPGELAQVGISLVKLNPDIGECVARAADAWPVPLAAHDLFGSNDLATLAADPLLHALLVSAPICDIEMERFLTMARCAMLDAASAATASGGEIGAALSFCGALARQCFINEYAFSYTPDEIRKAGALRDALVAALETNSPVPALWPLAVAAYFPLRSLPVATRLLDRQWPEAVEAVLVQQVREPEEERQLRTAIPRLTDIEDEVSLLVQSQYEENPYPRWVKAAPVGKAKNIVGYLCQKFPLASFKRHGTSGSLDILIAGCGTGQHSIGTAQHFRGARVLAIDLSLSSLGYAKRKTRELGLTSIEYAQADLLKLGSLGRSFDLIESAGVLHHLADPWAGWRVLLSLLRPGGFMKLGFYSEVARRNIVRIRTFIAEQGYGSTAEDIRRCRQDLVDLDKSADFGTTLKSSDFFSISTCRDLLFHVQEHRMTLTGIDAFLRENDLAFLGFEIGGDVLHAYQQRFPDDRAATNLGQWQVFENENPDTFIGMYQFWIQKAG